MALSLFIGLFSFILIITCLFLGLLILIQLPKKEAGIGQAFGGGATDALFGTGSGTALTKATKYAAGTFVVLCVLVSWLTAIQSRSRNEGVKRALNNAAATPAANNPAATPAPAPVNTSTALQSAIKVLTNAAAPAAAPAPAAPAPAPTPKP